MVLMLCSIFTRCVVIVQCEIVCHGEMNLGALHVGLLLLGKDGAVVH